jgi:hypothetical protein
MQAILIKSSGAEWLRQALEAGVLNGQAADEAARVLAENERLEHEVMILRGLTARQQAQTAERRGYVVRLIRRDFDRRRRYRDGRAYRVGLVAAGVCGGVLLTAAVMAAALGAVMA